MLSVVKIHLHVQCLKKKPLGRSHMRWKDIEALGGRLDWKAQALDREK